MTRAEQVLERLRQADGGWVDGSELATEKIGGSEGLRRLRELREAGHAIEERKHPDPDRDIYQYRIKAQRPKGVVAGQTPAFTALEKVPPQVMSGHAGTNLDPTWTEQIGEGFYDQSQRMYQAPIRRDGEAIYVVSAEFAKIAMKVDWVEAIESNGDCWRIPIKRLMDEGFGIELRGGARVLGAKTVHWEHIPLKGTNQ